MLWTNVDFQVALVIMLYSSDIGSKRYPRYARGAGFQKN